LPLDGSDLLSVRAVVIATARRARDHLRRSLDIAN
jgi:hypothetical protein